MDKQPVNILKVQVEKIANRCQVVQAQIERDEIVISEMVGYLLENQNVDVEQLEFCKDFLPSVSVDLQSLTVPDCTEFVPCPFQLQSKATHIIDKEIIVCLKITNSSSKYICDISGTVIFEKANNCRTFSTCRSVLLEFQNNKSFNTQEEENSSSGAKRNVWHKHLPVQKLIVKPLDCVYLIVGFLPPNMPTLISLFVNCYVGMHPKDDSVILHPSVESHKWHRWSGAMDTFHCDPWNLDSPSCFTDSGIFSPTNFLMALCCLTGFGYRKQITLQRNVMKSILSRSEFKWEKVSGQASVYYSQATCLHGLLAFLKFQDDEMVHLTVVSSHENTLELFMNKINALNIDYEATDVFTENDMLFNNDNNRLKLDLLNKEMKIMESLSDATKAVGGKVQRSAFATDGNQYRNVIVDLVSLELQRLCLDD